MRGVKPTLWTFGEVISCERDENVRALVEVFGSTQRKCDEVGQRSKKENSASPAKLGHTCDLHTSFKYIKF